MRVKVKMSLLVVSVIMCASLFSGFAVAAEPVEIGVILSLTGPIGPHGQDALHASQLAVEEINKAGGVLGRPMKLIVEDTESRPKSAVEAAHKLADVNKIVGLPRGVVKRNCVAYRRVSQQCQRGLCHRCDHQ